MIQFASYLCSQNVSERSVWPAMLHIRACYYQKLLEIEKEIVCEVACHDEQYLKQFADCKAQISSMSETNAFLICAL